MDDQVQQGNTDAEEKPFGTCSAYGCPMSGGIGHSVTGVDRWLCNFHFHAHASVWTEVTLRLNQRKLQTRLITAIREAMSGRHVDIEGWMDALKSRGLDDLMLGAKDRRPDGQLSMRKWLQRLEAKLHDEAMKDLDADIAHTTHASPDRLMDVAERYLKRHAVEA